VADSAFLTRHQADPGVWRYTGKHRPGFAETPGPGQESVWDFPRPPRIDRTSRLILVSAQGRELARTTGALRVCETASPPTFYIPASDVDLDHLVAAPGQSYCEWKGVARYWALAQRPGESVAWSYPDPSPAFADLRDCIAFYPGRVQCTLDGEQVRPQPGYFYGGWVTDDLAGPFKGGPGTGHW
jgi:uncharacterized protein (DUF427 family)